MTDTIEAVARAVCAAHWADQYGQTADADTVDNEWFDWQPEAQAAITALIEGAGDDETARWLFNLELETSDASLAAVEGFVLGGEVFKTAELKALIERLTVTIATARESERAAVVAWLKSMVTGYPESSAYGHAAFLIEAGAHLT